MSTRLSRADEGGADVVNTAASPGATVTLDLADGNVHHVTLDANLTVTFAGQFPAGRAARFTVYFEQDGTGGWTLGFADTIVWAGGTVPTWTTTAGAVDRVEFESYDGGASYVGFGAALALA